MSILISSIDPGIFHIHFLYNYHAKKPAQKDNSKTACLDELAFIYEQNFRKEVLAD
ncbi:hypothetical protein [Planococcus halocryophilus]|uniref:hypothetical protein n=1 Tax=Planococcus halocryophilus TaxID=1215089 RepID=UPI001F102F4F|nr:hypothetical protein [Planococcus halocryophilus]MCH4826266.1 hypothetical protein [Planococcus halocryophilus]